MRASGKTFVVTGGGNGIGRQVVLELLRRGARVAALDLREESLAETAGIASAGDRLMTVPVDITDRGAILALPDRISAELGPIDGLINVAGIIQPFVTINDLTFDVIERVMNVNFYGTLNTVKAFLPGLLQRPEAHIVNVSSMGGFLPVPGQGIYGASKAAVKLLSEALYAETLETPVGVSVVMPGGVGTDITANSGIDMPPGAEAAAENSNMPVTSPEDAARIILDGMESNDLHILVGKDAKTMSLAVRVAPRRATHMIQKRMKALLG